MATQRRILVVNAGLNGVAGNTATVLARASSRLAARASVATVTLANGGGYPAVRAELTNADALVIGTGTHWDSWSHLLQQMLEDATVDEGSALFLGKPAAVFVTMHSVGGKAVLSRLQGVLNTFGCLIPPMSGLVYSLANQAAIESSAAGADDLWSLEDVTVVCDNLLTSLGLHSAYRAWPTDRSRFADRWIRSQ